MILKHPDDHIGVLEGSPVTLEIKARGATPLYYQWYFNDRLVQGALNTCTVIWHVVARGGEIYTYAIHKSHP